MKKIITVVSFLSLMLCLVTTMTHAQTLNYVSSTVTLGNGNGVIEPNECNKLTVVVSNTAGANATNVNATLATTTTGVIVTAATSAYPNINVGSNASNTTLFEVSTSPAFVCGTIINFTLSFTYTGGSQLVTFSLQGGVTSNTYTYTTSTGNSIVPGTTDIGLYADDGGTWVTLPFSYTLYNATYTQIWVCSNGFADFGDTFTGYTNYCLPYASFNHALLPYWDDLYTAGGASSGEGIFTSTSGTAPNRIFNIEFREVGCCTGGAPNTNFEIRLYEGQRKFDFIYGACASQAANGGSATSGVQETSSTLYTQYSCNSAVLTNGLKVTYVMGPQCTDGGGSCGSCTLIPPANMTVPNTLNQCGANVTYPPPGTVNVCGTVTCTPASGSFFPVGTTTVNCNSSVGAFCSFTIRVNDTQAPSVTCPAPITVEAANCVNQVVRYTTPTPTDNCPGVTISCTPPDGSTFTVGVTTVSCVARDASNNTTTCTFPVNLVSAVKIAPAVSPVKIAVGCKQSGSFTKNVIINNSGGHFNGGQLIWTASTTAPEITLTPASPATGLEGQNLQIRVNTVGLPLGSYVRTITITGKNSVTNQVACNSPYTLTVRIEMQPSAYVTQTLAVGTAAYTQFTNSVGQVIAEVKSNTTPIAAFTVNYTPCQYPNGMMRLRYLKNNWQFTSNGSTSVQLRIYWSDAEATGITRPDLITIRQQPVVGGGWFDRGGVVDLSNNNVEAALTSLSGVFAEATPWTPKVLPLNITHAIFDQTTKNAVLQWNTSLVPNAEGFMIERNNDSNENWEIVGTVSENAKGDYGFSDKIIEEGSYGYRIMMVDNEGAEYESSTITLSAFFGPTKFVLEQNYPNPFNPKTQIAFSIPQNSNVRLFVLDNLGRTVAELVNGEMKAGRHAVDFDATNIPSGQYFYRIIAGSYTDTKSMMLTK